MDIAGSAAAVAEPGTAGLPPLGPPIGSRLCAAGVRFGLACGVPHALDGLAEDGRGGGEVQADEPGAAVAEHVTRADRDPGPVQEHAGRAGQVADDMAAGGGAVRVVQAEGAAVQPGQVGRLRRPVADLGQAVGQELAEQVPVGGQAVQQAGQPRLAVAERGGVREAVR
jgi:hypothetical protein